MRGKSENLIDSINNLMKIIIITPYWLQTKGGITTAVYYLSSELRNKGHLVEVLTPDGGPETVRLSKNRMRIMFQIIKILQKIKPDVIHAHAHGSLLLGSVIYKLLFNKHIRIIFTFHTQPHTQSFLIGKPTKERGIFRQFIFNYLLKYCDATTYVSRSLMESLSKTGVKIVNPVVILNGVMAKTANSEDIINFKQKYNLKNNYPILCIIATLAWDWKVKGVMILIEALKKVAISQPEARLLIVGDGQYRKYLEDYTKKENLEKKVIFTGNMDNPFIALFVCDVYCHISLNEAFGLAPLEAMIMGKPIIASNDAALPEIIMDGVDGILVDSNPNSVTKAILTLVEKPNFMRKLSENAIITAKTKFSWERVVKEYLEVYKNKTG